MAASYRDREKELSARLDEMKAEWEARLKDDRQTVGEEEIANVIWLMSLPEASAINGTTIMADDATLPLREWMDSRLNNI